MHWSGLQSTSLIQLLLQVGATQNWDTLFYVLPIQEWGCNGVASQEAFCGLFNHFYSNIPPDNCYFGFKVVDAVLDSIAVSVFVVVLDEFDKFDKFDNGF